MRSHRTDRLMRPSVKVASLSSFFRSKLREAGWTQSVVFLGFLRWRQKEHITSMICRAKKNIFNSREVSEFKRWSIGLPDQELLTGKKTLPYRIPHDLTSLASTVSTVSRPHCASLACGKGRSDALPYGYGPKHGEALESQKLSRHFWVENLNEKKRPKISSLFQHKTFGRGLLGHLLDLPHQLLWGP